MQAIISVAVMEYPTCWNARSPDAPDSNTPILAASKGFTPLASKPPTIPASTSPVPPTVIPGFPVSFFFIRLPSEIMSMGFFKIIVALSLPARSYTEASSSSWEPWDSPWSDGTSPPDGFVSRCGIHELARPFSYTSVWCVSRPSSRAQPLEGLPAY